MADLTDHEAALFGALKTVIEVVTSRNVASRETFALMFDAQQKGCLERGDGEGAGIYLTLAAWCRQREEEHRLLARPSKGSA